MDCSRDGISGSTPEPTADSAVPGDTEEARAILEQRCAERLLDDETLRADLTDDEFAPAQDWALARLHARVAALPAPDATGEHALEALVDALRRVLRTLNDVVGRRFDLSAEEFRAGLDALGAELAPTIYDDAETSMTARQRLRARAEALTARKDEDDGAALMAALIATLDESTPPPEEERCRAG